VETTLSAQRSTQAVVVAQSSGGGAVVAWYKWNGLGTDGMFQRVEEQIARQYEGKRSTWYKGKRMVY